MSNYGWTNDAGEPIMDGAAYRFEQQLDYDLAQERGMDDFYDDDSWNEERHTLDMDDTNPAGIPWCYGCDDYATNCDDNPSYYANR